MVERDRSPRILNDHLDLTRAFAAPENPETDQGPDPVQEAFDRGRHEGLELGRSEAREEYELKVGELEQRIAATLARLSRLEENLNREHERVLIELACEAAAKIARRHIAEGDPIAARALEEAIAALPATERVRARLHPDDVALVRDGLESELAQDKIELIADEGVERGGCVVESKSGTIDATLETAIDAVQSEAHG